MNHETIFQKALVSQNPNAILEVARAFEMMGAGHLAQPLYLRVVDFQFTFGAMVRGTPVAGTNGAIIPPGRYWQDMSGDTARKAWVQWTVDHPEVKVEKSEYAGGGAGEPVTLSVIFTIPSNATNYGLPGIWWPTTVMGFPSAAGANIQSMKDTVKEPPPMTYTDAAKEYVEWLKSAVTNTATGVANLAGSVVGSVAQGAGNAIDWNSMLKIGLLVGGALVIIPKLLAFTPARLLTK